MEPNQKSDFLESPHQTTTKFEEEGLIFDSKFDSGNLLLVEKKSNLNFDIYIASDCQNLNPQNETFRVWFYFKISSISNKTLKLSIKNLSTFLRETFTKGHIPVYHIDGENENGLYDKKWVRLDKKENDFVFKETSSGINLDFTYNFKANETVYFAYSYPWSYNDNLVYIKTLNLMLKNNKKIYFNSETIIDSLEQRKVHLLTLTSIKNQSSIKEKTIQKYLFTKNPNKRPWIFINKKYVVISARVHPGETPSSYLLQGCIDYILKNTTFLDNFVIVIVPMLNPDGVFRGYYRSDTNGKNLNRVYHSSYYVKYPSIFALKKVVNYLKGENRLFGYFDLHAHNIIEKSFLFGNKADSLEDQMEIMLIPQIMSMISEKFEIKNCKFESKGIFIVKNEENLSEKIEEEDKKEEKTADLCNIQEQKAVEINKKEVFPIAKTHFFKNEGIKLSYTFECSYNGGYLTDFLCGDQKNSNTFFFFDRDGFKEVGKCLIMSILEYNELNEKSILEPFGYTSINDLRQFILKRGSL